MPVVAPESARVLEIRRPFEHSRHERKVSCRECHGAGTSHRTKLVTTGRDCASCHHDERRRFDCRSCHSGEGFPAPRPLLISMALSVWDAPRTRILPFRHELHVDGEKPPPCRQCHQTPVTLEPKRECGSCHESHHRPEATCSTCHVQAMTVTAHRDPVHLSCAGAGCHASSVAPQPAMSRNLCLACHTTKADHEPQRACASCHRIPGMGDQRRTASNAPSAHEMIR